MIYDNETFFQKYSQMDRSREGLAGAGEWKTLESMLPGFSGKRVLDLGCGFGWHCEYAAAHGASAVLGLDLSSRMLEVARREHSAPVITYAQKGMLEAEFPKEFFDVIVSSLAFHYLPDFTPLARRMFDWLSPGGDLVFSVEHPVFTAYGTQDWYYNAEGEILHFPVDRYFEEGAREAVFLGETVRKYHRTLTTYLGALFEAGFQVTGVREPQPPEALMDRPGMRDELRRPMMLLISAKKP